MWPFLHIYGSHDIRHIGFSQVDGGQQDPRKMGCHTPLGDKNLFQKNDEKLL